MIGDYIDILSFKMVFVFCLFMILRFIFRFCWSSLGIQMKKKKKKVKMSMEMKMKMMINLSILQKMMIMKEEKVLRMKLVWLGKRNFFFILRRLYFILVKLIDVLCFWVLQNVVMVYYIFFLWVIVGGNCNFCGDGKFF